MSSPVLVTRTLRLRLKDKHGAFLREQSRAVNFVWNFCNELSVKHFERKRAFMSAYDMQPYTRGAGKELGLHSQTVQAVQEEYVTRRKQFKKVKLRWRVSGGSRRSLGWIPFKASAISYKGGEDVKVATGLPSPKASSRLIPQHTPQRSRRSTNP